MGKDNIMRKLKFLLYRKSLGIFFFVRPLLEYADVVWDNCTDYELKTLTKSVSNRSNQTSIFLKSYIKKLTGKNLKLDALSINYVFLS